MRIVFLKKNETRFAVTLFLLSLMPLVAQANVKAGDDCDQPGLTRKSEDRSDLVVCLKESTTSSKLVWKGMSGSGSNMAPCGAVPHSTITYTGLLGSTSGYCYQFSPRPGAQYYGVRQCQNGKIVEIIVASLPVYPFCPGHH